MEETELFPCSLGCTGACPPALAVIASLQTDSTGLLPQNKKVKERGFFTSCLATQGGKYNQRHGNSSGVSAVQEPALPCGEPAGPQPCCRGCVLQKGEQERHGGVEQLRAQIGAGQPQGWDATAAWHWCRKSPPAGTRGGGGAPLCMVGSLGSGIGCCHPARGQGLWPIAYHPRACRVGGPPSIPRVR